MTVLGLRDIKLCEPMPPRLTPLLPNAWGSASPPGPSLPRAQKAQLNGRREVPAIWDEHPVPISSVEPPTNRLSQKQKGVFELNPPCLPGQRPRCRWVLRWVLGRLLPFFLCLNDSNARQSARSGRQSQSARRAHWKQFSKVNKASHRNSVLRDPPI
jgi:hypothetical protein